MNTWRTRYGHRVGAMPRHLLVKEFSKQVKKALRWRGYIGNLPTSTKWKAQRCMWWLKNTPRTMPNRHPSHEGIS